jgi:hypothetical protein
MTRAQFRPRRRILDAVKRKCAPHTCKGRIVFHELDQRQDAGFTVSPEWNRDTGETQRHPYQGSDDGGEPGQATLADGLGTRLGPAAAFATTEHFNLQTARAVTVSEANGRASAYLAALSGNLIALAFVGQVSRLGAAFYAFALILLPVLAFVGLVTFVRLVQSSIEDLAYANRIALVRTFYLRVSPELEPYLVVARPSASAPAHRETLAPSKWQLTLTVAGMVAVVNSVVVAACAGLVLDVAGVPSLAIPVAVGAVIGAGAFTLQERHHRRARDSYSPGDVDRAAILISAPQPADAA